MAKINLAALGPADSGAEDAVKAIAVSKADSGAADSELVRIPIDQIGDRPAGDTRPLNPEQIDSLVDSISAVGLIAPLAVDCRNRLLAGGHRRAALRALQEQNQPHYNDLFPGGVPCRKFSFDSEAEPEKALQVEISENEKRRNYTREEIRAVAERLKQQGYSQDRGRGNKQPLHPALQVAFGVSRNTIFRALREEESNVPHGTFDGPKLATKSLTLPAELVERIKARARSQGIKPHELIERLLNG